MSLRTSQGVPEYDLLLRPGADVSQVRVRIEGVEGLTIADDGSLIMHTAIGPLRQHVVLLTHSEGSGGWGRERGVEARGLKHFGACGNSRLPLEAIGRIASWRSIKAALQR